MKITQQQIDLIISNSSGTMEAFRKLAEIAYYQGRLDLINDLDKKFNMNLESLNERRSSF